MDNDGPRSAKNRLGGGCGWGLEDGIRLSISEIIHGEGPGRGFAMTPWVPDLVDLDRAEALGETMAEGVGAKVVQLGLFGQAVA
jgi:hypothetical protein